MFRRVHGVMFISSITSIIAAMLQATTILSSWTDLGNRGERICLLLTDSSLTTLLTNWGLVGALLLIAVLALREITVVIGSKRRILYQLLYILLVPLFIFFSASVAVQLVTITRHAFAESDTFAATQHVGGTAPIATPPIATPPIATPMIPFIQVEITLDESTAAAPPISSIRSVAEDNTWRLPTIPTPEPTTLTLNPTIITATLKLMPNTAFTP